MKTRLAWVLFGVFLIYVAIAALRPVSSPGGFNLAEFGRLPVLVNGRVQPIDSAARMGLLQVRGTVTVPPEDNKPAWQFWARGHTLDATEWLLELLVKPDAADARNVFPVDSTLRDTLGLEARAGSSGYYAFKELEPRLDAIGKQVRRIATVKAADRAAWERDCLRLRNALVIYERLKNSLQPNSFLRHGAAGNALPYDFDGLLRQYTADLRVGVEAAVDRQHGKDHPLDEATEERMRAFARPFIGVSRAGMLAVIPPADPTRTRDRWQNIGTALVDSARTGLLPGAAAHFAAMSSAFARNRPLVFNIELANYRRWLGARGMAPEVSRARSEYFSNRFQPLVRATAIYLVAFVLICASWFRRSTALYRSAAALVLLAYVLHTTGLLFDVMLEGRLPIANLYAAIIFGGWGVVLLAGGVERFLRNGIGLATAALTGVTTLALAHSLVPAGGPALLKAVLDVNFCLAIAVMSIACGLARHAKPRGVRSGAELQVDPAGKGSRWRLGQL